jgi:Ca2+-binding EF-hand superfamily protein
MAMLPIMVALDADKDGELSAEEISNASAALMKLDKNNDGKIDAAEMRPEFPRGGFGGRPGDGPPQGGPRRPATDQAGGRGAANEGIEGFVARMMNFDKDDDGKLTKDEMPERMQSMMARFDTNKDDMIVREELVAAAKARMGSDRPQQGRPGPEGRGGPPQRRASADQMLQRLDENKDGFISSDELPEFLKGRMESLDKNSDGKLDKSELESMASQMRNRGGRGPGDGQPGRGQGRGDRPRGGRPQDDKP